MFSAYQCLFHRQQLEVIKIRFNKLLMDDKAKFHSYTQSRDASQYCSPDNFNTLNLGCNIIQNNHKVWMIALINQISPGAVAQVFNILYSNANETT